MSDGQVSVVTDDETFSTLEAEWDALLLRSRSASVFLRWAWLRAWWSQFAADRSLHLVLVRDSAGKLVGIGPFCVDARRGPMPGRALAFLGTERVSSEYLDVIAEADQEARVARAIGSVLFADARDRFDWVHLTDLLPSSLVERHILPLAARGGCRLLRGPSQTCPYLPLTGPGASGGGLGPNLRRNLRRYGRRLEASGIEYVSTQEEAPLDQMLDALYALHARRWTARAAPGNLADPRVRRFHAQLAVSEGFRDSMRIDGLRHRGELIACLYTLRFQGTVSAYQSGFRPDPPEASIRPNEYSPGFILLARRILRACEEGDREMDFLRGTEPYKRRFTDRSHRTGEIYVIAPDRVLARYGLSGWHALRRLKRALRGNGAGDEFARA